MKAARDAWRTAHEDEDHGRTAILFDGMDFTPFTFNSTDAQFLENRKFQIQEIARAFNIPSPMLGDLERATWSNSEQKGREFLSYTLAPWLRVLMTTRRIPRALCFHPPDKVRARTKAAPLPRFRPGPLAERVALPPFVVAADLERGNDDDDDRDERPPDAGG